MDFDPDPEQELLRETARRFLRERCPSEHVRKLYEKGTGFDISVHSLSADLGWYGILVATERGGLGGSVADAVLISEECGRGVYPGPALGGMVAAHLLSREPAQEHRRCWLEGVMEGAERIGWAFRGSQPHDEIPTLRRGASGFELSGRVHFIQGGALATLFALPARLDERDVYVLVAADALRLAIQPLPTLDVTRAWAGIETDRTPVADSAVLGMSGSSDRSADALATVLGLADSVGAADWLLATTLQYVRERSQFGRPVGSFQAIKHRCADMLMRLESSRVAVYDAALAIQDNAPDAAEAVAIAAAYAGEALSWIAGEAVQLHGGLGFTWEHDVHLYQRRIKTNEALIAAAPAWRDELAALLAARLASATALT